MGVTKGVLTIIGVGAAALVGYVVYKRVEAAIIAEGCKNPIYAAFYPSRCQGGGGTSGTTTSGTSYPPCDINKGIVVNCVGQGTEKCWHDNDCVVHYTGQVNICGGATATTQGRCVDCNDVNMWSALWGDPRSFGCGYRLGGCTAHPEWCTPATSNNITAFCQKLISDAAQTVTITVQRNAAQGSQATYQQTVCMYGISADNSLYGDAGISWVSPSGIAFNTSIDKTPYEYCQTQTDPVACMRNLGLATQTCTGLWGLPDISCIYHATGGNFCICPGH